MKKTMLFIQVFLCVFSLSSCNINLEDSNVIADVSQTLKEYGSGENVKIAIIDSGLSDTYLPNEQLLVFSEDDTATDYLDHGTPIYNIIADEKTGLAHKATVYSLKVINKYGNASTAAIVKALKWCLDNSIDIINMSLSFGLYNENVECLVSELVLQGTIIVASINNTSKDLDYPAMYDGVVCVGATDEEERYSKTSSIIFEKNTNITALSLDGTFKNYAGNSFLAPIVTGTIACLIDKSSEGRRRTNDELVEMAKFVLKASKVNIV